MLNIRHESPATVPAVTLKPGATFQLTQDADAPVLLLLQATSVGPLLGTVSGMVGANLATGEMVPVSCSTTVFPVVGELVVRHR